MRKKIFSIFIVMCIIFSILPTNIIRALEISELESLITNVTSYSGGIKFKVSTPKSVSKATPLVVTVSSRAGTIYTKTYTTTTTTTVTVPLKYYAELNINATQKYGGKTLAADNEKKSFKMESEKIITKIYTSEDLSIAKNNSAINKIVGYGLGLIGKGWGVVFATVITAVDVSTLYAKDSTYIDIYNLKYVQPGAKMVQNFIPQSNGDVKVYCTYYNANGAIQFKNKYSTTIKFLTFNI